MASPNGLLRVGGPRKLISANLYELAGRAVVVKSEECLVEAAQNGHLDSFAALYERYYGCMVALAYSVLADLQLSEDAAQESFAIACRDLRRLKRRDKFGPWIAGICRNVSRQMGRSTARLVWLGFFLRLMNSIKESGSKKSVKSVV